MSTQLSAAADQVFEIPGTLHRIRQGSGKIKHYCSGNDRSPKNIPAHGAQTFLKHIYAAFSKNHRRKTEKTIIRSEEGNSVSA